jgi:glycosyltransferase involved in cell wall biosynthesis
MVRQDAQDPRLEQTAERATSDQPDLSGDLPFPSGASMLMLSTVSGTIAGFLLPYAVHFRALGWRVDAAANGAGSNPALAAAFDHVFEVPLSRSILDIIGIVRSVRAISALLGTGPDIVHVHTPIAAFLTRLAARRMPRDRRPAVAYTAHGFHFFAGGHPVTSAVFLAMERLAGRWTDRLIVINDEDEAAALRHRIVPGRRLVRMPGIGLDTHSYSPTAVAPDGPDRVRRDLGIAADVPVFAVVGELNRNKRQRDPIAGLVRMRHQSAHLILAGDGPRRAFLETQAHKLGLRDRVHFLGVVDDIRPVVGAATALILPSTREGLARSVMEALALEIPVIASTARGNRELVGTDAGIIVPTGDIAALASAMDRLIDHPDEAHAMGLRGRERMVERYDLNVLLRMHRALYEEMLAERRQRTA